jgi:hypothetical protein
MFEHRERITNRYRTYQVAADDFELYVGDAIESGQQIGIDVNSGTPIYAYICGNVATIYYNPMSHSFLVMIRQEICEEDEVYA